MVLNLWYAHLLVGRDREALDKALWADPAREKALMRALA